jgi:microsomal dipeptidase-like Zn-dependent dipeptidase
VRRNLLVAGAVVLAAAWVFMCTQGDRFANARVEVPLPAPSPQALTLHDATTIIDLHADSLMWRRNLLSHGSVGHVDLPRLRDGGVAIQVFAAATRVPWNQNFESTDGDAFDALRLAGLVQWTPLLWRGPTGRALWMADKLRDFAAGSDGGIRVVETRHDLDKLLHRRARGRRTVGAILALEGLHAAGDASEHLDELFEAGYRMAAPTHFFDNPYAGSAHGLQKGGLTDVGRAAIARMQALGMAVDVAHLSPAAIDDVLAIATKPVLVSHGGVQGTCPGNRTLSDAHVRGIAKTGGVIGIGYFEGTVCGTEPRHVAEAVRYIVDLVGGDYAALGSDYDGGTTVGFDTGQLQALTQALLDAQLSEATVRKVLGENALRVLRATLPEGEAPAAKTE